MGKWIVILLALLWVGFALALVILQIRRRSESSQRTQDDLSDLFFARAVTWDRTDEQLVLFDRHHPRVITLGQWQEAVFAAADGETTVGQFIKTLAESYESEPPEGLAAQVTQVVAELQRESLVTLSKTPVRLPDYLLRPKSEQDPETYRRQMIEDEFIPSD